MSPFELDRHVHRDLRRLPTPSAPPALVLRVMAARARAMNRPWYARAWVTWPVGWRAASVAALLALVVGLGMSMPIGYAWGVQFGRSVVVEYAPSVRSNVLAALAVWRAIVQPALIVVAPVFLLMWAACAAFGVALTRIASGEVSRS
jgi:hypothetical protein